MNQLAATIHAESLNLKGQWEINGALGALTWFRTGGDADVLFTPADVDDLSLFLSHLPTDVPLYALGAGSNLLVRDGGVRGVVIIIGEGFATFAVQEQVFRVGSGMPLRRLARLAAEAGRTGFEFMRGIPGTVGGAVRMNGGAYGSDMSALLRTAKVMMRNGTRQTIAAQAFAFAYRHASLPNDAIVIEAELIARPAPRKEIDARMHAVAKTRRESQPSGARTGGSTFKNPSDTMKAWQLIEAAGCRDWREGGASLSPHHANFIVNDGTASAKDIETLGERIRTAVETKTGIALEWEIHRIGEAH